MTHADRIAHATYGIAHLLPQARRAQATGDAAGVDPFGDLLASRRAKRGDTHEYEPRPARPAFTGTLLPISENCLKSDGELIRITAIGLKEAPYAQRWVVLQDMRRPGQQGFTFADLEQKLNSLHVKGCTTYNRRIIRAGIGYYWRYDPRTDKIYPFGYTELCSRILERCAAAGLYDLFLYGNHPGSRRDMYIDVSGSAADFEAHTLAAWYSLHGCPTISRAWLSALLNRDRRSIWRLERIAGIEIVYNEAETTEPAALPLNDKGELRGGIRKTTDSIGRTTYYVRMVNTYVPGAIRQHHRRGQGRKAARSFKHWLETVLHSDCEGKVSEIFRHLVKVNKVTRTYCKNEQVTQRSRKRGNTDVLYTLYKPGQWGGMVWQISITHNT